MKDKDKEKVRDKDKEKIREKDKDKKDKKLTKVPSTVTSGVPFEEIFTLGGNLFTFSILYDYSHITTTHFFHDYIPCPRHLMPGLEIYCVGEKIKIY